MTRKMLPVLIGVFLSGIVAFAQSVSSNDRIILPNGFVEGKLDNGLSYVMVPNSSPDRMIELRLIFRAGSVLEDDGNRGAAHFLEHLAFGGTKHFPKRKMIEYLESLGVQYGIGINAYTGYDRTVYQIAVPSDKSEYFDKALLIIKDWLVGINLDPDKVESEKGIILEELRGYDVGDDFYNLKIGSGLYSRGIPLGTEDDIKNITPATLREFHEKWYTLSQATVAVVGDIDVKDAQGRIERTFGCLKATSSPNYREYPHTYDSGINYSCISDTLLRQSSLELIVPHECVSRRTVADAVEHERNEMLVSVLSQRMRDAGLDISISNTWYLADKEHFALVFDGVSKEELANEMTRAVAELYRAAWFGFTPKEMAAIRKNELAKFKIPDYSASSSYICEAIAADVMFGDRDIYDPKQFEWAKEQLASTVSSDLRRILIRWLFAAENTMLVACRFNPHVTDCFTPDELKQLWEKGKHTDLGEYVYVEPDMSAQEPKMQIPEFLTNVPAYNPSVVVSRVDYPYTGISEVVLTNGFRIVTRATNDDEGKVQVQLFAPGGLSVVPENDYPMYSGTAGYMELGGIEKMKDGEFSAMLADNEIGMILALENWWHGIIASAPCDKIPALFNVIVEKMLRPGLNFEEFEELRQDELDSYGQESYISRLMKTDYMRQMNAQIDSLMGNMVYGRRLKQTKDDLTALDLNKIADFYKSLYSNPSGMTCVICGEFDNEKMIRIASSVFGAIPVKCSASGERIANAAGKSHFSLPADGGVCKTWENTNPTQTLFDYILYGQYEPSLRNSLIIKTMQNLIRNRLLSVLREEESLVYSPYISLFYNAEPDNIFYFDINASVDRNNTQKVYQLLRGIISELQTKKVSQKELQSIKQIFLVNKRNWLEADATANWKTHIVSLIKNGETLKDFEDYEIVLDSISASDIRDAFKSLVDMDKYLLMSIGEFNK